MNMSHYHIILIINIVVLIEFIKLSVCDKDHYQYQQKKQDLLQKLLDSDNYNKNIRPADENGNPTVIKVQLNIITIDSVSDEKMEIGTEMALSQIWTDDRLKYDIEKFGSSPAKREKRVPSEYLLLKDTSGVWFPAAHIVNQRQSCNSGDKQSKQIFRIYPNGTVMAAFKSYTTLKCPMNFRNFPFDTQKCLIKICSFAHSDYELQFVWNPFMPLNIDSEEVEQQLGQFSLIDYSVEDQVIKVATGNYKCVVANISFQRKFGYYIIHVYVPCCMLTIISWLVFWLTEEMSECRISLGITSILTLSTQIYGVTSSLPPVSYSKALDDYTGICLTSSFLALLESFTVCYVSRTHKNLGLLVQSTVKSTKSDKNSVTDLNVTHEIFEGLNEHRNSVEKNAKNYKFCCFSRWTTHMTIPQQLDCYSRFMFPLMFLIMVLCHSLKYNIYALKY